MTVAISSESAPAGGTVEVKAYLSAPAALASGELSFRLDPALFGRVTGVVIYSAVGDGCGYATLSSGKIDIHFASASGTIGSVIGQPIVAFTVPVLAAASNGTAAVTADASGSTWKNAASTAVSVTVTAGTVTVGGSTLWAGAVSPAAGVLATGTTVRISGGGFTGSTVLDAPGISIASTKYISASELDFTLGAAADLGGKRITVQNPNSAKVDFFTVAPVGPALATGSLPDVFDGSVPVFPTAAYKSGLSSYLGSSAGYGGRILMRNPGSTAVNMVARSMLIDAMYQGMQSAATIPPGETYVAGTASFFVGGGGTDVLVLGDGNLQMMELFEYYTLFASDPTRTLVQALPPAPDPPAEVTVSPTALTWTWQIGTSVPPAAQTVSIRTPNRFPTESFTVSSSVVSGGKWFTVATSSTALTVSVDPGSLAPGIYRGSITVTPVADSVGTPVVPSVIPVALTITSSQTVNYIVGHGADFSFASSSAPPQSNSWSITSDMMAGSFTVDVLTDSGSGWLSAFPVSGVAPASFTVTANPASLSPGTYTGLVNVHGAGGALVLVVTATIPGPVWLAVDSTQLDLVIPSGGVVLDPALVAVSTNCASGSGTCPVATWTASVATHSGGNWLGATNTGGKLAVAVNRAGLAAGLYTGVVTLTSAVAATHQLGVTLRVVGAGALPALVVDPPSVELPNGNTFLGVTTGYQVAPLTITTSTTDGNHWLSAVSLFGNITPADLQIGADMTGLPGGVYHGVVTVAVPGQSVDIPVTVTVSATGAYDAAPSMVSVLNAASGATASISPGEIITIKGQAVGPVMPAYFTWTTQARVPTNLQGVQVLIDGKPAPILYASSQQINAIVPFEVAGDGTATVQVTTGAAGATWGVPVATAQPAIFTASGAGAGQGAILNQDNSYNGAGNPAARGSVVQIFATGIAFPSQTTGAPNFPNNVPGSVAVTIGGYDAVVMYAGPAPGAVAGLVQINAVVPAGVTPGSSVPIQIAASSFLSPSGVMIAVQ